MAQNAHGSAAVTRAHPTRRPVAVRSAAAVAMTEWRPPSRTWRPIDPDSEASVRAATSGRFSAIRRFASTGPVTRSEVVIAAVLAAGAATAGSAPVTPSAARKAR